jgi:type II secretory pathway predicted ATPase ExeA
MVAPIAVITGPSGAGKTTVGRLIAASFELSVHIRMDDCTPFVVNGWVEPWLPEAAHQNHVLGSAVGAGAMQFAAGGYTVASTVTCLRTCWTAWRERA